MSSIINSYGSYTFPSEQKRTALGSLKKRSHLINELLEMSRAPLKQKFEEEPLTLLDRTLDTLPDISDIAQDLYSDSVLHKKPRSVLESASIVKALTLAIIKPPLKQITIKKPALEDACTIQKRCREAIKYLYPKTLVDHPWLKDENPTMPEDTEFFVQAALNGKKLNYGAPFDPGALHLIQTLSIEDRSYIAKTPGFNFEGRSTTPEKFKEQERLSNLLFAQTSENITRVKAMTDSEIIFEHLKGGDLFDILHGGKTPISRTTLQSFCITLVNAFIEIKSKGFYYGDLKLENFFLSEDFTSIKLGDLGLTYPLTEQNTSGSSHYHAPEILQQKGFNSIASDVYGFGIFLHLYLYLYLPEDRIENLGNWTIEQIIGQTRGSPHAYNEFYKILTKQLTADSARLPTNPEELQEFIIANKFRSLIIQCLKPNPADRPTWESIKETLST